MLMLADWGGAGISAVSSQACARCSASNGTHHQQGGDRAGGGGGGRQGKLGGMSHLPLLEREQYCIVGRDLVVSVVPGSRHSPPSRKQSSPFHLATEGLANQLHTASITGPSRSSARVSKGEPPEATADVDDEQDTAPLWTQHWGKAVSCQRVGGPIHESVSYIGV